MSCTLPGSCHLHRENWVQWGWWGFEGKIRVFRSEKKEELANVHRELKKRTRKWKKDYRRKMEGDWREISQVMRMKTCEAVRMWSWESQMNDMGWSHASFWQAGNCVVGTWLLRQNCLDWKVWHYLWNHKPSCTNKLIPKWHIWVFFIFIILLPYFMVTDALQWLIGKFSSTAAPWSLCRLLFSSILHCSRQCKVTY